MPILDPLIQYKLVSKSPIHDESKSKNFFMKYLQIASYTLCTNLESTLSYIKFKNDFRQSIKFINEYFQCEFEENDINVPNIYDYIYNKISHSSKELEGEYIKVPSLNYFHFFEPYLDFSQYRSWFLTDTPIAVLCLRPDGMKTKYFQLIRLEIDLLTAAGLTLVLVISDFGSKNIDTNYFLAQMFLNSRFAEVHINYDSNSYSQSFHDFLDRINKGSHNCDSFFYLYKQYNKDSPFFSSNQRKYNNLLKDIKKTTRIKIINFGNSIKSSFEKNNISKADNFKFCLYSIQNHKIKVILCDVPIYDSDDENKNIISTEFSNIGNNHYVGFISPNDFLFWEKTRVEIQLYVSDGKYINKYVDFDDLHSINPVLYVDHPINLARVKIDELKIIDRIIEEAEDKYELKQDDEFKREFFFSLFKEKKAINLLMYVLYAYKKYCPTFNFYKSQVFVALRAINFCILQEDTKSNHGFVYQVATGEGKSIIVILIAAVLALFKKTVHVVTSNIVLANRDFNDSFHFFRFLGIKSAALVHDNEMPSFENGRNSRIKKHYPDEFFHKDLFKNSMSMNFDVCGVLSNKNKADIIFSTIVNFESLYLYMNEKVPGKVDDYYKKSSLVIDEADLILIDELPNGTILSRPMKSNAEQVLSYVYDAKTNNKNHKKKKDQNKTKKDDGKSKKDDDDGNDVTAEEIYNEIRKNWPECNDITIKDIKIMFEEIKTVNTDEEFNPGTKYAIVPLPTKDGVKYAKKKYEIIPFDFDHTGILERNKEFSGFIPQFISLKERRRCKPNEEIIFKEISMNYLYVSHPIYVNLYNNVCGLTGTIGNEFDKDIYKNHYNLSILKVPRENPNRRYEFPTILCDTLEERNDRIVEEIMQFHIKGWPVLAIFFSPFEIEEIKKKIMSHKLYNKEKDEIGVYNGMDDAIKPDKKSGQEGAISLGTNVCGRGTHIKVGKKPLHVIVSFYSSNTRSRNQAFGRTARQKDFGTVRTICLLEQYFAEKKIMNRDEIQKNLNMLSNINSLQNAFVDHFRLKKRDWIFDGHIGNQKIQDKHIATLRSTRINVNRIDAFEFNFPVGMSIKTFLDIQSQKIFSIYNCPNSKYTWRLFQQYVREMLLESWSLLLNKLERLYAECKKAKTIELYQPEAEILYNDLVNQLTLYLPENKQSYDIVETFMWIFELVNEKYKTPVLRTYEYALPEDENAEEKNIVGKTRMQRISFGFRPFTLKYKSGSRILSVFNTNPICKYIEDPELKYLKAGSPCSITSKVDIIFEKILNKISDFLGDHLLFKLFLRRTLAGCEFGLCYEVDEINKDEYFKFFKNVLFDKDPLFVFSIYVKSVIPFLAGILMLLLLYITNIIRKIIKYANGFTLTAEVVKDVAVEVVKCVAEKLIEQTESTVIEKLIETLCDSVKEQIKRFEFSKPNHYRLMSMILTMLSDKIPDASDKIYEKVSPKFNFKTKSIKGKIMDRTAQNLFRIGFLIILCAASFLMNFHANKSIKYSRTEVAEEFTKNNNEQKVDNYVDDNNKILDAEMPNFN